MTVRKAEKQDVPGMVALSEAKRTNYETHSPIFWRKAENSAKIQAGFFLKLLETDEFLSLVHEENGVINGFIIGRLIPAPPVYNPGGKACVIDDFAVASPSLWGSVGVALRNEVEARARQAGATVSVTVCGAHDQPKRQALTESGAHLASEWYVRPIAAAES